jgi:hypothetical protein
MQQANKIMNTIMTNIFRIKLISWALLFAALSLQAQEKAGVAGGLTLLQEPTARALALAGTVGVSKDDISAFAHNPASLATLQSNHASILFHRGLTDDTLSQLNAGLPLKNAALGFGVGYYDGGDFHWSDGITSKEVTAQTDLLLTAGYARRWGLTDLGITLKVLQSELIETAKATAYAMDLGAAADINPRLRWSASLENLGTELTYKDDGDKLPAQFEAGASSLLIPEKYPTTVLIGLPYSLTEKRLDAALGVETLRGPLAFRLGYKTGIDLGGLNMGVGFALGNISLDYAFGLIDDLNSIHEVSLSLRFGKRQEADLAQTPRGTAISTTTVSPPAVQISTTSADQPGTLIDSPVPTDAANTVDMQNPSENPAQTSGEEAVPPLPLNHAVSDSNQAKPTSSKIKNVLPWKELR